METYAHPEGWDRQPIVIVADYGGLSLAEVKSSPSRTVSAL